jgi:hypothetical protein
MHYRRGGGRCAQMSMVRGPHSLESFKVLDIQLGGRDSSFLDDECNK